MGEIGTRLSISTDIIRRLVENQAKNIVEGGLIEFSPDLITDIVGQTNLSINEIDAKFANLTKNVGITEAAVGGSSIIAVAYASSLTKVTDPAVDTDLVTVSFTTTGKPVLVIGIVSLLMRSTGTSAARATTKIKRDTTELDLRMISQAQTVSGDTLTTEKQVVLLDYLATVAGTYTYKITGIKDTGNSVIYSNNNFAQEPSKIFVAELNF